MGDLLLVRATGPRRGDVVSVLPQDQHPGNAVAANEFGQWAFVYLQGATRGSAVDHLLRPKETDLPEAREDVPMMERAKNEVLDRRLHWIDLDSLPTQGARDFMVYSEFNRPTAYRVALGALENARRSR